tara:strand:- start:252 stop:2039 length:1788 start_codon:yes stop_codon:yes gene_type:complete
MNLTKAILNESSVYLFRRLWKAAEGARLKLGLSVGFLVLAFILRALEPLVLASLVNEIQRNGITPENLGHLLFISSWLVILVFFFLCARWIGHIFQFIAAFRARINHRAYLLTGVLGLGLGWHSARDSGDTIDKVNQSANGLYSFGEEMSDVIKMVIGFITSLIAVIYFSPVAGLVTMGLMIGMFWIILLFDRALIPKYKTLNNYENKIVGKVFDTLSNITSVVVLRAQNAVFKDIRSSMEKPVDLYRKMWIQRQSKWWVAGMLFYLIIFGVLGWYIYRAANGLAIAEAGSVAALLLYLSRLGDSFFTATGVYGKVIQHKTSVQNAESIENDFIEHRKTKNGTKSWRELVLKDIHFQYDYTDGERPHLNQVNFTVRSGERVALIGESGSGKTTFLKVLHGMYPTAQASISFDGTAYTKTNFNDYDLKTTLVPQEPEVFSASIRENITLGLDYSEEEIFKATDLAQFTTVIHQLPRGLDSIINEKGVNLSGGQKQRLALSRALLFSNGKEVMLFDESTSSVDPETEVKIYKSIFDYFSGKTIIASIHKMNLLKYFDRILIFANGKIIDEGSFDELLEKNSKFRQDWQEYVAQSSKV